MDGDFAVRVENVEGAERVVLNRVDEVLDGLGEEGLVVACEGSVVVGWEGGETGGAFIAFEGAGMR